MSRGGFYSYLPRGNTASDIENVGPSTPTRSALQVILLQLIARLISFAVQISISVVDRLQQMPEGRRFLDRPDTPQSGPEIIKVSLGQQPDCNYSFMGHTGSAISVSLRTESRTPSANRSTSDRKWGWYCHPSFPPVSVRGSPRRVGAIRPTQCPGVGGRGSPSPLGADPYLSACSALQS